MRCDLNPPGQNWNVRRLRRCRHYVLHTAAFFVFVCWGKAGYASQDSVWKGNLPHAEPQLREFLQGRGHANEDQLTS